MQMCESAMWSKSIPVVSKGDEKEDACV